MVRLLLVVEVPDPGDERATAFLASPGDGLVLGFGRVQYVVGMVFDDEVVDGTVVRATLGACFDIDVRHRFLRGIKDPGVTA